MLWELFYSHKCVGSLSSYSRQLQMVVAVIGIQVLRSAAWNYTSQSIPSWTPLLEVGFYLHCYGVRQSTWNLFWASKHFYHFYVQRTCSRERKLDKISRKNGFNVAKTLYRCRWLLQHNVKLWHVDLPSFTGMTHLLHKLSQEFIDCQLSAAVNLSFKIKVELEGFGSLLHKFLYLLEKVILQPICMR